MRTGIGWHTYHLIEELASLPRRHRYVVVAHRPVADPPALGAPNVAWRTAFAWSGLLWQQTALPRILSSEGARLFHSPLGTLPAILRIPAVVTVHDLTPRLLARAHTIKNRIATGALLARSMRKAKRVIAVSEHTRGDAVLRFGIPRDKIVVIGNGIGSRFRPVRAAATLAAVRDRFASGRPFFLYVGTLEPRKNLVRLIEAYARFLSAHPRGPELVVAGGRGWDFTSIFESVRRLRVADRVRFADYVDARELPLLYSAAFALLYPSLYEGFGLPAAEAMACGTPVLASSVSSLPEVVGDAGLLVDPLSVEAIRLGIERIYLDGALRRALSRRGIVRAKRFRWRDAARRTLAVYESCL